jgi:hypothetical protein
VTHTPAATLVPSAVSKTALRDTRHHRDDYIRQCPSSMLCVFRAIILDVCIARWLHYLRCRDRSRAKVSVVVVVRLDGRARLMTNIVRHAVHSDRPL